MKDTLLPSGASNTIPDPYSHGYMYGGSAFALVDKPYPPEIQAAARAGKIRPNDYTGQNPSYSSAAGGVISTANDLATWVQALVGGRVLNADYRADGSTPCSPRTRVCPTANGTGSESPGCDSDRTCSISTAASSPASTPSSATTPPTR